MTTAARTDRAPEAWTRATARRMAGVMAVASAVVTVLVVGGATKPVDEAWTDLMAATHVGALTTLATALDVVGGTWGVTVTVVLGALLLTVVGRLRLALAWATLVSTAALTSTVLKVILERVRPDGGIVEVVSPSYPSGHALTGGAAVAIGLAALSALVWPRSARWSMPLAVGWAVLMAWSRTYLLVHWLSDVVGGVLIGSTVVAVVVTVMAPHLRPAGESGRAGERASPQRGGGGEQAEDRSTGLRPFGPGIGRDG